MRDWNVTSYSIAIAPKAVTASQPVRRGVHKAVLDRLDLRYSTPRTMPESRQVPERILLSSARTDALSELFPVKRVRSRGSLVVLDLSAVDYAQLREAFLESLATFIAEECKAHPASTIFVVLLPFLPPAGLYWSALDEISSTNAAVITLDRAGQHRIAGSSQGIPDELGWEYAFEESQAEASARDRFASRVIPMMGHFPVGDHACTQYYYDASMAVRELYDLLVAEIGAELASNHLPGAPWLVVPKDGAPWLIEAAELAAERTHCEMKTVALDTPAVPRRATPGWTFLCMDTITSGQRFRSLRAWSQGLDPRYVRSCVALRASGYPDALASNTLRSFMTYRPDRIARDNCPQCALGLPFSDKDFRSPLQLRSYDLWTMLGSVQWLKEPYGGGKVKRDASFPSMLGVIEEHSTYLAFCFMRMMRYVSPIGPLAFVCADEPAISALLDDLARLMRGDLQAIRIPRDVLDLVTEEEVGDIRELDAGSEWDRQLRYASEQGTPIVIGDEFVASGSTLASLNVVLSSYRTAARVAIPLLNRSGMARVNGIPIQALYDLFAPREGRNHL